MSAWRDITVGMSGLTVTEIRLIRQDSLLLENSTIDTVLGITEWFGAMQAQDLASAKWSYGARIAGLKESDVDAAIRDGQILRTWPMRGTIHFVPAIDARWMLNLTSSRTLAGTQARRERLGLTLRDIERASEVASRELAGGKLLSRSDILQRISDAGVSTEGQRGYHVLWHLSHIGLTCIGPQEGKQQTFALLDEWAPKQRRLDQEQGLAELALRYYRSHGPGPHQELMGWAGITAKDAKAGIASCGDALCNETFDGKQMWMVAGARDVVTQTARQTFHALPGFDEFILGFKDRSLIYAPQFNQAVIPGNNGIFRATIAQDGQAIGTWTRKFKRSGVEMQAVPFTKFTHKQFAGFKAAASRYGEFRDLETHILDVTA